MTGYGDAGSIYTTSNQDCINIGPPCDGQAGGCGEERTSFQKRCVRNAEQPILRRWSAPKFGTKCSKKM